MNEGQYFLNNVKLSPSKAELKVFIQEQEGNKAAAKKDKISAKKDDSLSGLLIDFKKEIE